MTVTVSWDRKKEKWMAHSTVKGHIGYRKTRKEAKKLAKGSAQKEASDRDVQVQVRWEQKDGSRAGGMLVYPAGTPSEDRIQ